MSQQQTPHKLFIQMSGAPGSGKSTMAKMLGCSIDGVIIDHDVIRSTLLKASTPFAFDQAAALAYQLQWALAQDMMKQGRSIIIDSTCNFQEVLDQGSALAKQYGFTYWYVECKVQDIDLLDQRLRSRDPMASQRTGVDCPPAAARGARAGQDARALFQKWIDHPCRP
ncbi:atp-binding [Trichoderma arundinaceum]|uniref:Atp-binding n=1 Tax=Trichoderma arundinaceum TaxID=490622 RepID=A0A395NFP6_TRIAR|nr:atp-binding [Trichoderma arundinaceum]